MADEKAKAEKRHEPSHVAWRWWVFWKGRSGWRTVWALILAIPPLLALIYLALPAVYQTHAFMVAQATGQALGATGLRVGIEVALAGCALSSFALLVAPGFRKYPYLRAPTSVIPPITVYVDTENINGRGIMDALMDYLRRGYLVGSRASKRADLLFFMDASHVGSREDREGEGQPKGHKAKLNWKYESLYLNGFRLVDSPHDPTGKAKMLEAADREIALHAFERALLGPERQEFIIASGDGDFAPLIYRLAGLGHSVQMWIWGETGAYDVVADYLPLTIHHLDTGKTRESGSRAEPGAETPAGSTAGDASGQRPTSSTASSGKASKVAFTPRTPPVVAFPQVGMAALYYAIYNTIGLCDLLEAVETSPSARNGKLNATLGDGMKRSLAAVGYIGKGSSASWLRLLIALRALSRTVGGFPQRGLTSAAEAARQQYDMALAIARATVRAVSTRPDHAVGMKDVIDQLSALGLEGDRVGQLLTLLAPERDERYFDARYLVHCARSLGLLQFDEVVDTKAYIVAPRLTALAEQIIAEQAGGQPDATAGPEATV